jgi:hypothetical protein
MRAGEDHMAELPTTTTTTEETLAAPDALPHELQFRLFEQLTTLGTAGAGLGITLIGSILKGSGFLGWMAVIWFAAAALLSLAAQTSLTDTLFAGQSFRHKGRNIALVCAVLIGMGVGSLGASVFLLGKAA